MIFIGTGSEVEQCMGAAQQLFEEGISSRVVSMPCMEIFEAQSCEYQQSVIPDSISKRLVVEAGSSFGWFKYYGCDGDIVSVDTFGSSGPAKKVFEKYGFTTEKRYCKSKSGIGKIRFSHKAAGHSLIRMPCFYISHAIIKIEYYKEERLCLL